MEAIRYNRKIGELLLVMLGCALFLTIVPPHISQAQDDSEHVESERESLPNLLNNIDSMNHVLKVEYDLLQLQKNDTNEKNIDSTKRK